MSRKKLSKVRRADPFFERESARYDFPLPSREYVSQVWPTKVGRLNSLN
jgi:ribonuclease R